MKKKDKPKKDFKALGYVRLWRGFRDDPLWRNRRKFSQWEAWLDMYLDARGVDTQPEKPMIFHGHVIPLKRGQLITSQRELAHRWRWPRNSVRNFFSKMERRGSILIDVIKGRAGYSLITFLKYNELNPMEESVLAHFQQTEEANVLAHQKSVLAHSLAHCIGPFPTEGETEILAHSIGPLIGPPLNIKEGLKKAIKVSPLTPQGERHTHPTSPKDEEKTNIIEGKTATKDQVNALASWLAESKEAIRNKGDGASLKANQDALYIEYEKRKRAIYNGPPAGESAFNTLTRKKRT